jgi:hypothetical protein
LCAERGGSLAGLNPKDLINGVASVRLIIDSSMTLAWYFEDEPSSRRWRTPARWRPPCGAWTIPLKIVVPGQPRAAAPLLAA